jgi:mycoredoxin
VGIDPVEEPPMTESPVLVYYKPGCPYSAKLRAKMTLARVPHRSVRFRDDEEGAAAVRAHYEHGYVLSPTVLVRDEYRTNPTLRYVRESTAHH